jgi:hypothetical protein
MRQALKHPTASMNLPSACPEILDSAKDPFLPSVSFFSDVFLQTCFPDTRYECSCDQPYEGADPYVVQIPCANALSYPEDPLVHSSEPKQIDGLRRQVTLCQNRLALPATDVSHRIRLLFHVGAASHQLFLSSKEKHDIVAALDSYRSALQLAPDEDPYRMYILAHAGKALHDCYGHGMSVNARDLLKSLHLLRQAALACNGGHPLQGYIRHWRWHTLRSLANLLIDSFHQLPTKSMTFLEDTVHCAEEALDVLGPDHPDRHRSLLLLGNVHRIIAEHTEYNASLDNFIECCKEAVILCPNGHPWRWQNLLYLGLGLQEQANWMQNLLIMGEATEAFREAALSVPDAQRALLLMMESDTLNFSYKLSGDLDVLAAMISLQEVALEAAPPGHEERHQALYAVAEGLIERYKHTAQNDDAQRIIQCSQEMLDLIGDHPARFIGNHYLAWIYLRHTETPDHLRLAIKHFSVMVRDDLGNIQERLPKAMVLLLEFCTYLNLYSSSEHYDLRLNLLQVYRYTLRLLPRKAFLGQDVAAGLKSLSKCEMLATDAAVLALRCALPEVALECLAEGRTVFWTQALHLRASFDGVSETIAKEMKALSHFLEQQTYMLSEDGAISDMHSAKTLMRRQSARFEELVAQVRAQPGLENFFHSPPYISLVQAARTGPVIVLVGGPRQLSRDRHQDSRASCCPCAAERYWTFYY